MAETDQTSSKKAGASSPVTKILPIAVIVVVIAAAVWYFTRHRTTAPAQVGKPTVAAAPAAQSATSTKPAAPAAPTSAAVPATTPAPAPVQELTVDQLIQQAGAAFKEGRYVAPAGNNAVEYYLRVLAKDPKNQIAKDALREIFPFATGGVEQEINSGNLDDASREIDELSKVDPTNYTLTILRSKLDAKKKQAENEQKLAAAAAKAAAAKQAEAEQAAKQAAEQAAAPPPVATPKPVPPPPPPKPAATAQAKPSPPKITRPAELVKSPSPSYPPEAYRSRQSGWVEVSFTVTAKGTVTDATVSASQPARVFNTAALEAVRHWTFKPRMEDGKAVPEKVTRRIEFKLGG